MTTTSIFEQIFLFVRKLTKIIYLEFEMILTVILHLGLVTAMCDLEKTKHSFLNN